MKYVKFSLWIENKENEVLRVKELYCQDEIDGAEASRLLRDLGVFKPDETIRQWGLEKADLLNPRPAKTKGPLDNAIAPGELGAFYNTRPSRRKYNRPGRSHYNAGLPDENLS